VDLPQVSACLRPSERSFDPLALALFIAFVKSRSAIDRASTTGVLCDVRRDVVLPQPVTGAAESYPLSVRSGIDFLQLRPFTSSSALRFGRCRGSRRACANDEPVAILQRLKANAERFGSPSRRVRRWRALFRAEGCNAGRDADERKAQAVTQSQ